MRDMCVLTHMWKFEDTLLESVLPTIRQDMKIKHRSPGLAESLFAG